MQFQRFYEILFISKFKYFLDLRKIQSPGALLRYSKSRLKEQFFSDKLTSGCHTIASFFNIVKPKYKFHFTLIQSKYFKTTQGFEYCILF